MERKSSQKAEGWVEKPKLLRGSSKCPPECSNHFLDQVLNFQRTMNLPQSDTSGISGSDSELMQEERSSFMWLNKKLNYGVDMTPKQSPIQGGVPFCVTFSPSLDAHVFPVHAIFVKSDIVLGNVEMVISPDCLYGRKIPGASSSGWGNVIFKAPNGIHLGSTELFYYSDDREVVFMVNEPSLLETLCKDMSCHTANSS